MGASGLLLLILLGALMWFWQDTLAVRERATRAAGDACRHQNLQLLDGTVALHQVRLRRRVSGALAVQRTFVFAYSEDGLERRTGFVISLGNHIEQVGL